MLLVLDDPIADIKFSGESNELAAAAAQPLTGVLVHRLIGFADWPETEVVGPTVHHSIEFRYHCLMMQLGSVVSGFIADRHGSATRIALDAITAALSPKGDKLAYGSFSINASLWRRVLVGLSAPVF